MNKHILYLFSLMGLLSLAACTNEENPLLSNETGEVSFAVSEEEPVQIETRASFDVNNFTVNLKRGSVLLEAVISLQRKAVRKARRKALTVNGVKPVRQERLVSRSLLIKIMILRLNVNKSILLSKSDSATSSKNSARNMPLLFMRQMMMYDNLRLIKIIIVIKRRILT